MEKVRCNSQMKIKSTAETSARIEKQIQNQQELLSSVNEQSIRSNKLLGSIQRTFNRIETLSGTFWLELPYSHTAFESHNLKGQP